MSSDTPKTKTRPPKTQRLSSLQDSNATATLALIAHELRNPLASIQIGLKVLEISPTGAEATRTRALMHRQLEHALHLIDDLLDLSRINTDQFNLAKTESLLQDIINLALEGSGNGIKTKHHTLRVELPNEPIIFNCDRRRLTQVIMNLIDNSAKYTPEGGTISLTVLRSHHEVIITVTDNGVGLAPEAIDSIFQPFYKARESSHEATDGLGLGLFLVRSFVEAHGGTITAQSAGRNCGASFRIALPG